MIEIAVEQNKGDQEKMGQALQRLAAEDPSFRVTSDFESGQTIIKGMGELHLEILVDRMKREFKVDANIGQPQVAYQETITVPSDIDYTHKKQTGGAGQPHGLKLGSIHCHRALDTNFQAKWSVATCRRNIFQASRKVWPRNGLWPPLGFPVTDFKAELYDGTP